MRAVGAALLAWPRRLGWLPPLAWAALIWFTSSQSPAPAPRNWGWRAVAQNFLHAPAYGFLALLLLLWLPARKPFEGRRWIEGDKAPRLTIVGLVLVYGITDECHQGTTPGRDLSVLDIVTDVVAALCVLWIVDYLSRPEADGRGLTRRLVIGLACCLAAALLASYVPYFLPSVSWV